MRHIHSLIIQVYQSVSVPGKQHVLLFLGIKYYDSMVPSVYLIVSQNLDIHVIGPPHKVLAIHDLVILSWGL